MEDIANATDYAVAAIEIVDSRIAKWDIRLADTVADNASSGGYVLGSERKKLVDIDLVGGQMAMERRCGSSREVLDCVPGQSAERGRMARGYNGEARPSAWRRRCGSHRRLGPMVAVAPGDDVTANIEGIGTVRARSGWIWRDQHFG